MKKIIIALIFALIPTNLFAYTGSWGFLSTTTPNYYPLSVFGTAPGVWADHFVATSTTATSTFRIASSTCFWNGANCLTYFTNTGNWAGTWQGVNPSNFAASTTVSSQWTTSGANIYRASGNVGIGTTGPGAKLDVEASNIANRDFPGDGLRVRIGGQTAFWYEGDATANRMQVYDKAGTRVGYIDGYTGALKLVADAGFDIIASTLNNHFTYNWFLPSSSTGDSRIEPTGDWGIGTTGTAGTRMKIMGVDTTSSNYALKVINSSSNPLLTVRNDGNVGIGTTSPIAKLAVVGNIYATSTVAASGFLNKDTITGTCYLIRMTSGVLTPTVTATSSCP